MASLRYLTPFFFLALLPLGVWLGGPWTFAAAVAIPSSLTIFDAMLGKDRRLAQSRHSPVLPWLPRTYIVLQLATTAWIAILVSGTGTSLLEAIGLALSNGLTTGVFGLVAAHEMIHGRDRPDRALGLIFLTSVFYVHFSISHVRGHHRRAGTPQDPTTARLGESLYAFIGRSVVGQFREAWNYEARRRRRVGLPVVGAGNRMIAFVAIELAILLAIALASRPALAFVLVNAALAILLLETFNYVAHYGLVRRTDAGGTTERLGPQHSWNSSNWMNNAALFNTGRHSDHHRHVARRYPGLKRISSAPELPSGFAAAMLAALVPPLWHRLMDQRAMAARDSSGVYNCNRIVYSCSRNADRQENQRRRARPHGGAVGRR